MTKFIQESADKDAWCLCEQGKKIVILRKDVGGCL